MESIIGRAFMDSSKAFWSVDVLTDFVDFIDGIKEREEPETSERSFELFDVKMCQAINEFLRNMNDLKMIMNCRTKCDDDSHFGGEECARFMSKVVEACSAYIKDSKFLGGNNEGDLGYAIRKMREKARKDRSYAVEFEKSARTLYTSEGIDKTEEIFKSAGYMNGNKPFRNIRDFAKEKRGANITQN